MIDLLAKQNEHLLEVLKLLKQDRLLQVAQTVGVLEIDQDDLVMAGIMTGISKDIRKGYELGVKTEIEHRKEVKAEHDVDIAHHIVLTSIKDSIDRSNQDRGIADKAHLESLKKLQDNLSARKDSNDEYKSISDNVIGTSVTKTWKELFKDMKSNLLNTFGEAGTGPTNVTGSSIWGGIRRGFMGGGRGEEYDYIREEKNRGNEKTDTDLKADFQTRRKLLLDNESNENRLKKIRGGQSESDFLKMNSKAAQTYTAKKIEIGKGLKEVDSRFQTTRTEEVNELDDYKKNERNLGNKRSNKTLDTNFLKRAALRIRNESNEKFLETERGSLTEEEYLSGESKGSRKYLAEKSKIGRGLKKVDSRYTIGDEPTSTAKKTPDTPPIPTHEITKVDSDGLRLTLENLEEVMISLSDSIPLLIEANKKAEGSSNEDTIEANRASKAYQHTQLEHSVTQNETLTEQLDTQKKILEILKEPAPPAAPTSDGTGVGDTVPSNVANKAKGFLKKAGTIASRAVGVLAAPVAIAAIGTGAAVLAANEYSESFGEGGFDVVKKLHDEKIIDYNATVAGFNPSEVLDWEGLEKVPPEDIKKLLDSGVEFSPEDTSKIKKIYEQNEITGGKDAGSAKPATTSQANGYSEDVNKIYKKLKAEYGVDSGGVDTDTELLEEARMTAKAEGLPIYADPEQAKKVEDATKARLNKSFSERPTLGGEQVTPSQANPLTVVPRTADSIYNQSAETTASSAPAGTSVINNISSPNTVNNNGSGKSSMKTDIKNPETSVGKMFANRQQFR